HVYHLYVVRTPERDRLRTALEAAGVAARAYYRTPLHLQPVFSRLGYEEGSLPVTERAARENLALPMWAGISIDQQRAVVSAAKAAVAGAAS
ncbi:MAG: DegT/DnrJ/EryC1/StrS family aminotransferase, partial [Gaiellales bacterium]